MAAPRQCEGLSVPRVDERVKTMNIKKIQQLEGEISCSLDPEKLCRDKLVKAEKGGWRQDHTKNFPRLIATPGAQRVIYKTFLRFGTATEPLELADKYRQGPWKFVTIIAGTKLACGIYEAEKVVARIHRKRKTEASAHFDTEIEIIGSTYDEVANCFLALRDGKSADYKLKEDWTASSPD